MQQKQKQMLGMQSGVIGGNSCGGGGSDTSIG